MKLSLLHWKFVKIHCLTYSGPYILLDAEKNKDGYYVPNEEEIVMYRSKILFPEYITSKHEGDEFIRFTIEDMNISIKNALNCRAKFNGKS